MTPDLWRSVLAYVVVCTVVILAFYVWNHEERR